MSKRARVIKTHMMVDSYDYIHSSRLLQSEGEETKTLLKRMKCERENHCRQMKSPSWFL